MRITGVGCEVLEFTEFYERDALAVVGGAEHPMEVCLVRAETADGMVGFGEAIGYGSPESVMVTVNSVLSRIVRGEDSSNIWYLWDKMYRATFRLGRRGIVVSAMSGVDIALWDLAGKELGAPIYRLLGGNRRRMRGYITGGYYRPDKDIPRLIEEVEGYVRSGFKTVKIKVGGLSIEEDLKRLSALRERFGEKLEIAVDANNVYDFNQALKIGRGLERLGIIFFEEPLSTDYPELSARLAAQLDVPIAGYETAFTIHEFRELISRYAVDIVQADAAWNGGITEMVRIGVLARSYGLPLIPHYSAGGIGFVASLHAALTIDSPLIEYHLRPNPLREALAGEAIKHSEGYFEPPLKPGLGVAIREEEIEKFKRSRR
ncbi:MAG: mandelate racemase/muconate lactonizing enzyme family protein [Nitrososphaerota archaeon]